MLKQAAKHLKKPGLVSLGGGLPSAENFPFESLSMQVPTPAGRFSHTSDLKQVTIGKHDVRDADGVLDLSIALNYGQSIGSAQLLRWVTEHTELAHAPPYADWRCALTVGSTGSLEAAYRMFGDRTRGDGILTEEYSFSTALETAAPLGLRVFGVAMDEQGLLPSAMDELLSNWDPEARGGARRPRVLYTVPSGQNPTGATQSEQRRREVYKVCQKHDVFIFEDEPYYFLQMQPYQPGGSRASNGAAATTTARAPQEISSSSTTSTLSITPNGASPASPDSDDDVEAFLRSLVPSMLSMDTDGRVMRHDSFSKVVVPGSRVGWVTASEQVIERYIRHAECCSQGPSGFSQAVLYKLLDEEWGHANYLRWLMHLRDEYSGRRDAILRACERFLPGDVVSWTPPAAGMFVSSASLLLTEKDTNHLRLYSCGSRSTTRATRTRPPRRCCSSKRRSSTRASKRASWPAAGPGSAPSTTSPSPGCSSARRTRPPPRSRWPWRSSGSGRRCGGALGFDWLPWK